MCPEYNFLLEVACGSLARDIFDVQIAEAASQPFLHPVRDSKIIEEDSESFEHTLEQPLTWRERSNVLGQKFPTIRPLSLFPIFRRHGEW